MSDLLRLAALLPKQPGELAKLLVDSGLGGGKPEDLFDLARQLLARRRLEPIIRDLSAADLEALLAGVATEKLRECLLADDAVLVTAQEIAAELKPAPPAKAALRPTTGLDSYVTLLAVTELIFASERHWLKQQRGGLTTPDARELALRLQLDPVQLQLQFEIAVLAGLIAGHGGRWLLTERAEDWLGADRATQWSFLARAVCDTPPGFQIAPGQSVAAEISRQFPLSDQSQLGLLRAGAELTLISDGMATEHLQRLLENRPSEISKTLPQATDRMILQSDLTLITPGPISAELHRELDYFAEAESLGLAARFRISEQSLTHALECGKDLAGVQSLLEQYGELPQPLRYLLTDVAQKFGSLRVIETELGSLVASNDSILLTQIANESKLRALSLHRSEHGGEVGLASRMAPEVVYFNLREAGYAAVRVDAAGSVLSPRQPVPALGSDENYERALVLAERLLATGAADESELLRKLRFAQKHRLPVRVRVNLPGGEQVIQLALLGVTASRIRGRDLAADAERTLPLRAITELELG